MLFTLRLICDDCRVSNKFVYIFAETMVICFMAIAKFSKEIFYISIYFVSNLKKLAYDQT